MSKRLVFVDKSCASWWSPFGRMKFKNGTFVPECEKQEKWMVERGFTVLEGVLCPRCGKELKNSGSLNLHYYHVHGIKGKGRKKDDSKNTGNEAGETNGTEAGAGDTGTDSGD